MVASRDAILDHLADYLRIREFRDYAPQGLQVEGRDEVAKVVTGVTASAALFERAIAEDADMVLVHHGLFFKSDNPVVKGGLKRRLATLLANDVTLACYHLPLDAHPEIGNNAIGLRDLGLVNPEPWGTIDGQAIGFKGHFEEPVDADAFFARVKAYYAREPLVYAHGPEQIRTVALVSGGAQGLAREAVEDPDVDCFVTGEVSEWVMTLVQEAGLHFVSAGHYATEVVGIRALGEHVAERFGVDHAFIDVPNPV